MRKNYISFFFLFFLFLLIFLKNPQRVFSEGCRSSIASTTFEKDFCKSPEVKAIYNVSDSPVQTISTILKFNGIPTELQNKEFSLMIYKGDKLSVVSSKTFIPTNSFVEVDLGNQIPGSYFLYLVAGGYRQCDCSGFTVPDKGQGGLTSVKKGTIIFNPSNPTVKDKINILVENLPEDKMYFINIFKGKESKFKCIQSEDREFNYDVDPLISGGSWQVVVMAAGSGECKGIGDVVASGEITISQTVAFTPTPTPFPPPCLTGDMDDKGKCKQISTGLGVVIPVNPAGFVKSIFGILLSLSGGIALILIIMSGYQLMTSQGNPEKVQAAKETLTSAIVGLLFIIFSMVILQIIGVTILKIPGIQ